MAGIILFYYKSTSLYLSPLVKGLKNIKLHCFSVSSGGLLFPGSFMTSKVPQRESFMAEKQKNIRSHFLSASVGYALSKSCLYFSPRNHFLSVINTDNFTRLGKT